MLEDVINENLVPIPSALSTGRSGVCVRAWEELSAEEGHLALTSAKGEPASPGVCASTADAGGLGPGLCHVRPSRG